MEFSISTFSEISDSNYQNIKHHLLDPKVPIEFKSQLINLLKDHSSKALAPPISQLINSNMVPVLIGIRSQFSPDEKTIINILWIITNILTGTGSEIDYVINQKGIEYILEYIPNDNKEIVHQAVWGLSNIVGESPHHRDMVLKLDVLEKILYYFNEETETPILKTLVWFICNLTRGHPLVDYSLVNKCFIYLKHIWLFCYDTDVLVDFLWAISYFSELSAESVNDIINSGLIPEIIAKKMDAIEYNDNLLTPFIRSLGNFASGDELATSFIINLGILEKIGGFLSHPKSSIRKETAFLLSNIAAGNTSQVLSVLNLNQILEKIQKIFQEDEPQVKKECIWIVANLFSSKLPAVGEKITNIQGFMECYLGIYKEFQDSNVGQTLLESYKNFDYYVKEEGSQELKETFKIFFENFLKEFPNKKEEMTDLEALEEPYLMDEEEDEEEMPDFEALEEEEIKGIKIEKIEEKIDSLNIED